MQTSERTKKNKNVAYFEQKASEKSSYAVTPIIISLMIFGVILSFFIFSRQSLRLDESQSLWQTSHTPSKILNIIAQDVHVPLYHFLLHFWQVFLSTSVFSGRVLSLIFFLISIPAMYFLGKRAFSRSVGIFATILFAVSPFMNWYGNEIRMYSLFTLMTILSQYFFIRIYRVQDNDAWMGYFLVNLFGIFTHYFFFFVILVQVFFYVIYKNLFPKNSLKKFIIIAIILGLIFSPWLWYVKKLGSASNETPQLVVPTSVNVFNTFSQFLFGFQNDHLNTILVSLWPLTILLGFLALRENKKVSPETMYILMSFIIPIAAAFIVSITYKPVFLSRYLILTIPSMYLFVGWIFSTYPTPLRKTLKIILIFSMLASLTVEAVSTTTPVKENYREATTYLEQNATPQDIIIISAPFTVYPVEYYYRGSTEIATLPMWDRYKNGPIPAFNENTLPDQINTLKGSHEKAWVLLSYDQGYQEKIRIYLDTHLERIFSKTFSPGLTLYAYRLRYDIPVFKSTGQ